MEFLQEPTFTALLALILSIIVAKIVSFAVSNSTTDGNTVVSSVTEGPIAQEVILDRGLRVRSSKGQKRVKFVDDVLVRTIDRYEGSENLVLREGEGLSEDSRERKSEGQRFDVRESHDADAESEGYDKGKEGKVGMGTGGLESEIVEDQKSEEELDGDDAITDEKGGNGGKGTGESEGVVKEDDDDWEGIERTELEKVFAEAVNYVEYGGKEDDDLGKLSSDVQMQLYGLHKVAVEGPCAGPQPMALKVSARAKWNAWQKLGSMSQEAAMEQYIRVVSDSVPGWIRDYSADENFQRKLDAVGNISVAEHGRKSELSAVPVGDSSTGQSSAKKDDVV